MKSINRKLNDLENNVFDRHKIDVKTTAIAYECLSEPEQRIIDLTHQIVDNYKVGDKLSKADRSIIQNSSYVLNARIHYLFTTIIDYLCEGDSFARSTAHERLAWFIQEMRKEIKQNLKATEIEKETPPTAEVDKVDEYYSKAPKVFTDKSWCKFQDDLWNRWVEHLKETGEWDKLMKKMKVKP